MADYKIGYKRPPKRTQFKKGVCPNPRGRGKKIRPEIPDTVETFRSEILSYRENGVSKKAPRVEVLIRHLVRQASQGNILGADQILTIREYGEIQGGQEQVTFTVYNSPSARYEEYMKRRHSEDEAVPDEQRKIED